MSEAFDKHLAFLREMNAETREHSELELLSHLVGTRRLLQEWGARPTLLDAGLFHSVYGTEGYQQTTVPLSMRAQVQEFIGSEAESLVWLFCFMRRNTLASNISRVGDFTVAHRLSGELLSLTDQQFDDLVNLTFANELEAYPRMLHSWRQGCRAYLQRLRHRAILGARSSFDTLIPRWWEFWK